MTETNTPLGWRGANETGDRYKGQDPRDIASQIKREAKNLRFTRKGLALKETFLKEGGPGSGRHKGPIKVEPKSGVVSAVKVGEIDGINLDDEDSVKELNKTLSEWSSKYFDKADKDPIQSAGEMVCTTMQAHLDEILENGSDGDSDFTTVSVKGEVVGVIETSYNSHYNAITVEHLGVRPDLAGPGGEIRGAGTRLLQSVLERAENSGIDNVNLVPTQTAEGFYKKVGFEFTNKSGSKMMQLKDKKLLKSRESRKKKTKEAAGLMEPFKQSDGDKVQNPKVHAHQDAGASPVRKGKMNPSGYGASKKERI